MSKTFQTLPEINLICSEFLQIILSISFKLVYAKAIYIVHSFFMLFVWINLVPNLDKRVGWWRCFRFLFNQGFSRVMFNRQAMAELFYSLTQWTLFWVLKRIGNLSLVFTQWLMCIALTVERNLVGNILKLMRKHRSTKKENAY